MAVTFGDGCGRHKIRLIRAIRVKSRLPPITNSRLELGRFNVDAIAPWFCYQGNRRALDTRLGQPCPRADRGSARGEGIDLDAGHRHAQSRLSRWNAAGWAARGCSTGDSPASNRSRSLEIFWTCGRGQSEAMTSAFALKRYGAIVFRLNRGEKLSGLRGSNPSNWLGKPGHYHYAKPAYGSEIVAHGSEQVQVQGAGFQVQGSVPGAVPGSGFAVRATLGTAAVDREPGTAEPIEP